MEKIQHELLQELYLLFKDRNELIIPNFGIFKANSAETTLHRGNGELSPTVKHVADFEANNNISDNRLMYYVTTKYQLSEERAKKEIDNFVTELKTTLTQNQSVTIPYIGEILIDALGEFRFKPSNYNLGFNHFGLPTLGGVVPVATAPKTSVTPPPPVVETKTVNNTVDNTSDKIKSYWELIMSNNKLLLLLITFILLLLATPIVYNLNKKRKAKQSTTPIVETSESTDEETIPDNTLGFLDDNSSENSEEEDINTIPTDDYNNTTTISETTQETTLEEVSDDSNIAVETVNSPKAGSDLTYVVVGTFKSKANAEKMVTRAFKKGYYAEVQPTRNGMYRTSIILDDAKSEISKKLKEIRKDYKSAWVIK